MAGPDKSSAARGLRLLGPGLVAGAADDDPSGVATYSQAGAQFGYGLLWTLLLTAPLMIAMQLVSARIGRVTGRGVVANARVVLPKGAAFLLAAMLLAANIFNIAADLAAMGAALGLIVGGQPVAFALAFGAGSLVAQIFIPYRRYASFLKWSTLALFSYVAAAFAANVDWREALSNAVWPRTPWSAETVMMIVAVLGTTISPYLFVWQAAQEIEEMRLDRRPPLRGVDENPKELRRLRLDTSVGMILSNAVAFFIILTTAATLHAKGVTEILTADAAAQALRPIAGEFAFLLFAIGIIGSGLLAAPVLAGSAGYAVSEILGWESSLEEPVWRARGLYAAIAVATLGGAVIDLASLEPMKMLVWSAVLNGVAAAPFMIAMMAISASPLAMGRHATPPGLAVAGWTATVLMCGAVALLAYPMLQ